MKKCQLLNHHLKKSYSYKYINMCNEVLITYFTLFRITGKYVFNLLIKDQIKVYINLTFIVSLNCLYIHVELLTELNLPEYPVSVRFRDKASRQKLPKRPCSKCEKVYYTIISSPNSHHHIYLLIVV